jgi:hypothetical protein
VSSACRLRPRRDRGTLIEAMFLRDADTTTTTTASGGTVVVRAK